MSNLNKDELLKGVRNIIDEQFSSNAPVQDWTNKFGIKKYINALLEQGHKNPKLMSFLIAYDNAITNGTKEFMMFEDFGKGLTTFASGNPTVKKVIENMNQTLASYGMPLVGFQLIERLRDPGVADLSKDAFNNYLNDKCEETKNMMYDILESSIMANDPAAVKLNLLLTDDSAMSPNFIHEDYVSEQEAEELEERLQEQRDKKKADEIFGKVKRYLEEQFESNESKKLQERVDYCLNAIANNQGLDLEDHIASIKNSNASSNERLMNVLEQYSTAIRNGAYEERLYETFLHNIGKFNYLIPVDNAIKKLKKHVNENKEQITLTKLLEEMKDDHSSFIYVDLIQEDVARYVKEPSAINRVQLRNALMPYASDPYINEMFNIIYADNSRRANELEEAAMNIKDQIKLIRENAEVSSIYTPVQYVKENECVFNVNGQFYVKKGNNIFVLDESNVDNLDERFVELCQLVNNPYVTINENNTITLSSNNKYATIYEGCVEIMGHKETRESLRDLRGMCMKYDDYDTNFYIMCSCLLENFNDIAKVDWAKHITLNENNNINADIFKLDNNIFLATHNESLNQHTFYRNINPIFCKNKLNEHMGINVSSMFEDLLPNQDKIIMKLNETQNQYQESIDQYEEMIDKMKEALDDASEKDKEELQKAIDDAESKLDDLKDEYKKWQEDTEKETGELLKKDEEPEDKNGEDGENGEGEVITQEPNKPIEDDEVDAVKDELSQPLEDEPTEGSEGEPAEGGEGVSDDEFISFMGEPMGDENPEGEPTDDEVFEPEVDNEYEPTEEPEGEPVEEPTEEPTEEPEENPEAELEQPDEEQFKEVEFPEDRTEEPENTNVYDDTLRDEDVFDEGPGEEPTEEPSGEVFTDELPAEPVETEPEPEIGTESTEGETYQPDFSYKIANVMFNENVKDGTKEKSGSVIIIVPMVDGAGRKYIENKTVEFYLNDEDNMPILDNEPMTNELYAAVIDAIKSHPDYPVVCDTAEPATVESPTIAPLEQIKSNDLKSDEVEDHDWEDEYLRGENAETSNEYPTVAEPTAEPRVDEYPATEPEEPTDDVRDYPRYEDVPVDDEMPNWGFEDKTEAWTDGDNEPTDEFGFKASDFADEAPAEPVNAEKPEKDEDDDDDDDDEDVIIPTYKDGDTEIEFPAANVDNTLIPESAKPRLTEKKKISIKPKFKTRDGKSFF